MPHSHQIILDIEFADDTAVYLQGDLENLKKLESGLAVFCKRSNAMINWHKSCAIWLSQETHPAWHPHPAFKWINQGASTKYLGFQIGFNIPPETMIAPVIHSIRQKLIHWSSKKLSLAGRIIVANQVLLATAWYSLSCWTISKESIHQIQRLVRNYIWSGKENHIARAKMAWPILTAPKSRGGLGLIDPLSQSKALLDKFVV